MVPVASAAATARPPAFICTPSTSGTGGDAPIVNVRGLSGTDHKEPVRANSICPPGTAIGYVPSATTCDSPVFNENAPIRVEARPANIVNNTPDPSVVHTGHRSDTTLND